MADKPSLSTKWYNVIRRQLNAVKPVNEREDVPCPDCGSETTLATGRYGRFYGCCYCSGTHGAKLDGTPRKEQGTPEEIEVRHRARDAVHRLVVFWESRDERRVVADFVAATRSYHIRRGILEEVLEDAGVPLKPPPRLVKIRKVKPWTFGPIYIEFEPGLHLRKRTIEQCLQIERVATAKLREIRKSTWDRIILDGDVLEIQPC